MKRIRLATIVVMVMMLLALSLSAATTPVATACGEGCTRTPGYWKNHPERIPSGIPIGPTWYSPEEIVDIMQRPVAGNKLYTMFNALAAAKLNMYFNDTDTSCIAETIAAADAWFNQFGTTSVFWNSLRASDPAWKAGEPLYLKLDAYNNGLLSCAQHCD